jgi:hypothetical protein
MKRKYPIEFITVRLIIMSSIDIATSRINAATSIIVLVLSLVNFLFGAVGLIFNILVFTRPALRRQSSSFYFFSTTCCNLFIVLVVIPVRIVSDSFNIDLANYNLGICKLEHFAVLSARSISCWLIALACIDRYLHSSASVHIRRMSTLKTARFTTGFICVAVPIFYSPIIIYLNIEDMPNQFGSITPTCAARNRIYSTFIALWHMTLYTICPSFLMLLFGCLTLINLRQRGRVVPAAIGINRTVRRTNIQLLHMLTVQVFVIVIATLPYSINLLYASFSTSLTIDTFRIAQETLSDRTVASMTYFAHSTGFYLYTLTGTVFRKEFFKIIKKCWHPHQNRVQIIHNEIVQMAVLQRNQQVNGT